MPNINAFEAMVHEKRIFKHVKISPFLTPEMAPFDQVS